VYGFGHSHKRIGFVIHAVGHISQKPLDTDRSIGFIFGRTLQGEVRRNIRLSSIMTGLRDLETGTGPIRATGDWWCSVDHAYHILSNPGGIRAELVCSGVPLASSPIRRYWVQNRVIGICRTGRNRLYQKYQGVSGATVRTSSAEIWPFCRLAKSYPEGPPKFKKLFSLWLNNRCKQEGGGIPEID
jgi:hypothetical protein